MKLRICFTIFTPILILFSNIAAALENQRDEEYFLTSCNIFLQSPLDQQAHACSDYLHGFLAGARVIDSIFIAHLEDEHNEPLSFTERAYRTRVGRGSSADSSLPSAPFCLPDSEFNGDIIDNISVHLPDSIVSLNEIDQKVYTALSLEYPCR